MTMAAHSKIAPANATALMVSHAPALSASAMGGMLGMMSSGAAMAPLAGGMSHGGRGMGGGTEINDAGTTAYSLTAGQYRFVDGSGYLGRVGEYDTLDQSAGTDMAQSYVSKEHNLTIVSRASVMTGSDYSAAAQLTWADRLQAGLFIRSFLQQQDNYPFYAFPVLDVPPGSTIPPDSSTNLIPNGSVFGVTRRMGNASARFKVPRLPVHLFVRGDWQAHAGTTQLSYLDENTGNSADTCGAECHHTSAFQAENYTTRNIAGGVQVDLKQFQATWEHTFSSFNDRLNFPTGNFGGFFPEVEGISAVNPPPNGPAPPDVPTGNYALNIPPPSQFNADRLSLNWTASPNLLFNGNVGYTRVNDTYTRYSQNWFNTDETLSWRPINRLRVIADYHQQNVINDFVPYYSLYGNVSYHNHDVGVRADYELLKALDAEVYYKRSGITRSNATLWPQIYSIDNTDLLTVVPSSTSNTTGLAVRYHDQSYWSMRVGYEWTGTNNPGYLIVPQTNNRMFADVWITPAKWLVFSNDLSIIWQNGSPAIPLLRADGTGAAGDFQRNNRYYFETASATLRLVPDWDLSLGYSYQQNNLSTYMAFQNDPAVGYVLNQPVVPFRQITQAYWGESSYTLGRRLGLNMRITYNSSRSSLRPDLNPANAATMGNATLIQQGVFDPVMFSSALNNLNFASTQISGVIVPQWIGQGKVYYLFPRKFEGGFVFYYGSYRDYWNPNVNGVLRTATIYVGKSW